MSGKNTERLKALVVDDNPVVLQLVRAALLPHAAASVASSAADALASIRQEAPDIIVTDYAMPGMNGHHLLEALRADKTTADIPVVLLASRSQIAEELKPAGAEVEEFIEKPFFVGELSARLKKVLDKIALEKLARGEAGEDSGDVVRGNLALMSVMDLLQSLEMGRKTCALTLSGEGQRCVLYFSEGQIHHAVCGGLTGDSAVFEVVRWNEGNFQIDFRETSAEQTTTMSTQGLLMEGLRLLDESNAAAGDSA